MSDEDYQLTPKRERTRDTHDGEYHRDNEDRRQRRRTRSRDISNDRHKSRDRSKEIKHKKRDKLKARDKSHDKYKSRDNSRDRPNNLRDASHDRYRSRDNSYTGHSKSHDKSHDRDRARRRSKERHRSPEGKRHHDNKSNERKYQQNSIKEHERRNQTVESNRERSVEFEQSYAPHGFPTRREIQKSNGHSSSRRGSEDFGRNRQGKNEAKTETKTETRHFEKDRSLEKESASFDKIERKKVHKDDRDSLSRPTASRDEDRQKKDKRRKERKEKKTKTNISKSRLYHSDSELESRNKKSRKTRFKTATDSSDKSAIETNDDANCDKPIDINALYNLFYRDTDIHNESGVIKEAMLQKMFHEKQNDTPSKQTTHSVKEVKPVLMDQSNVRSKLIKVLFQRVKDLLKETEDLRNERKTLYSKIDTLTDEVERLKQRDIQQLEKENQIKERLEVLADEMKITAQGTSFREEIQNILQNIQSKYQTHWKDHENKIHKVQTDAEIEIQQLMRNIVGKYVQLTELKDRTKVAADVVQKQSINEPLHIDIENKRDKDIANYLYQPTDTNTSKLNKNNLLLKVVEPLRNFPAHSDSEKSVSTEGLKTTYKSYGTYTSEPDGKDSTPPTMSTATSDTDRQSLESRLRSLGIINTTEESKVDEKFRTLEEKSTLVRENSHLLSEKLMLGPKSAIFEMSETLDKLQSHQRTVHMSEADAKRYSLLDQQVLPNKEFWRHKLLQPKPLESLRNEQQRRQNPEVLRNQY